MDLRIPSSSARIAPPAAQAAHGRAGAGGATGVAGGFTEHLRSALHDVSRSQHEAARLQNEVLLGNPAVGLEETMLAMQKAQIGFQATLHVRNRMVQAYTDIMNMSV